MQKPISILYVEDEIMVQDNTRRPLEYMCDQLFIANNGLEGLALYKNHLPDIVVSDIKMPKLNGIEMVKEIKKINKNQHVIFTTAHSESTYFIDAIELQADGYILKPLDYDLLEEKINSIIRQVNLEYQLQQQNIIIDEISKSQNNLLTVLDMQQNIIFANNQFFNFFNVTSIDTFMQMYRSFNKVFQEKSFFTQDNWITTLQNLSDENKIIQLFNPTHQKEETFFISFSIIDATKHIIITFTEITDLTQQVNDFKDKAFRDELTQIYNRAYFNQELQKQITLAQQKQTPFSLIFFDIDKFKNFNDTYGHQMGDTILSELSNLINTKIRQTDILARWGGEEFIIILPNTSVEITLKVAQKLRLFIQNNIFSNQLQVTCSFGVTQYKKGDTAGTILKRVDKALYQAKENGRNKVEQCQN